MKTIDIIKNEKECVLRNISGCDRDCANCDLVLSDEDIISAYDEAVSALEKQIPKKPLICNGLRCKSFDGEKIVSNFICPNCRTLLHADNLYCKRCGQALDWSDETE